MIASLVRRIDPASLLFDRKLGPPYGEYNTGKRYAARYDQCREDHPDISPITGTHVVPLSLVIMMDKCAVGRMKKISVFPLYIAIMNQSASVRYEPSSVSLLAYLPHFPSSKLKKRPSHKHLANLRVTHHCIAVIFDALRHFKKDGLILQLRDGTLIIVDVTVDYCNTDNEEQNDQCSKKRVGAKKCSRQTLMKKELIGTITSLEDQTGSRRDEFVIRTNATHRAVVARVHAMIKARRHVNDGTMGDVDRLLDEYSIHPTQNAYWDIPMAPGGIYAATPAEILHMWPQGIMAKVKKDTKQLLEIIWKSWRASVVEGGMTWSVDLVESRMRSLHQFTDGITSISHFPNGVWTLVWVSAEDHISMFQQLVSETIYFKQPIGDIYI